MMVQFIQFVAGEKALSFSSSFLTNKNVNTTLREAVAVILDQRSNADFQLADRQNPSKSVKKRQNFVKKRQNCVNIQTSKCRQTSLLRAPPVVKVSPTVGVG
jgi:7-keto-8-aminopelargonate synthetase-like enzyme